LGATILKARSPNLSLDRGKNKSKFDADLRTVGRVESVKTGCIKQIARVWDMATWESNGHATVDVT